MATRYIVSAIAIVIAGSCSAQLTPGSDAYDAWKLTRIQYPQPAVHPSAMVGHAASQRDGEPCACWIEPDSSYILALGPNDDGSSNMIPLPFTFSLYGEEYTSCYINNNGNVSFGQQIYGYTASAFPMADQQSQLYHMVAPFWADVDTRVDGGTVMYRSTPHALYVNWSAVGYYNMQTDKLNSFQLIISDGTDPAISGGNNVSFCYGTMEWTTGAASQGVGGFGGVPATVGANRGNGMDYLQLGRFDHDSTDWDGPFGNNDGVAWLTDRHYSFNTSDEAIPPIFSSIGCDTLDIEVGTSMSYPMMMIAGGPGQVVTGTSQCESLASYTETITSVGSGTQIMSSFMPTASEVGVHTITYSAQTNDPVPLTSTYTVFVNVSDVTTGIRDAANPAKLFVQPNPAMDHATITWPAGQQLSHVEVFAMNGAVVISGTPVAGASQMELDLRGLPDGIYTVRATGATSTSTIRLVRSSTR